jgi:hypothetical protein
MFVEAKLEGEESTWQHVPIIPFHLRPGQAPADLGSWHGGVDPLTRRQCWPKVQPPKASTQKSLQLCEKSEAVTIIGNSAL